MTSVSEADRKLVDCRKTSPWITSRPRLEVVDCGKKEVMAWMHKAARISCAKLGAATVRTLAVEAIDFPAPSTVGDHLVFFAEASLVFSFCRQHIGFQCF